jgi:hypothetical protein
MDAKTFVISRANELGYFPEQSDVATIVHNAAVEYARHYPSAQDVIPDEIFHEMLNEAIEKVMEAKAMRRRKQI